MPASFILSIHLRGIVEKEEAAKLLSNSFNLFTKYGLEPMQSLEAAWESGTTRIIGGISLIHPEYSAQTNDPLWGAGFMYMPVIASSKTVISITIPASFIKGKGNSWDWLLSLSENLCDELGADMGLINGLSFKGGNISIGGTFDSYTITPGQPPDFLYPWMYWSKARLFEDNIYDGLKSLVGIAARSSLTACGGWILKVHENYSGSVPIELLEICKKIWNVSNLKWKGIP